MNKSIVLPKSEYKELLNRIDRLEKAVGILVTKLESVFEKEPKYGTKEWWKWANRKGEEDIKAGRYKTISSKKELKEFFASL